MSERVDRMLERLRAAEAEATPGPWVGEVGDREVYTAAGDLVVPSEDGEGSIAPADGAFIIVAREAVPVLLAEVERRRATPSGAGMGGSTVVHAGVARAYGPECVGCRTYGGDVMVTVQARAGFYDVVLSVEQARGLLADLQRAVAECDAREAERPRSHTSPVEVGDGIPATQPRPVRHLHISGAT